jgi:hypothetical protein
VTTRTASAEDRQLALLWLAAAVSAVALRPLWLAIAPLLRPCVFRSLTGVPCPTCGTTRAAAALLNGDLPAAIAANPLATAAGLLFIVGAPLVALWTVARGPIPILPIPLPARSRIAVIGLVIANWAWVIATG